MAFPTRSLHLGILAVTVLMVVAGCSGVVPGGEDGDADREPFGVGEDEVQPGDSGQNDTDGNDTARNRTEPEYLAPGVTADGVVSRRALLEAHFAILENESQGGAYVKTEQWNRTINESFRVEGEGRIVVEPSDRWFGTAAETTYTNSTTETTLTERWVENETALYRIEFSDGRVTYHEEPIHAPEPLDHPRGTYHTLDWILGTLNPNRNPQQNVTALENQRNGPTKYAVTHSSENYTARVHIRADGLITQYFLHEQYPQSGKSYRMQGSFEVTSNETVERPDWYDRAREETGDDE